MKDGSSAQGPTQDSPVFIRLAVPEIKNLLLIPETNPTPKLWNDIKREGTRMIMGDQCIIPVEGEHLFDLYCIEKGSVQIVFDTLEGRQRSVMSFSAGAIFNLACAAARQEASGQYLSLGDTIIWRIAGSCLTDTAFIARCPELVMFAIQELGLLVLTYHTFLTDMLLDDFVVRFCRYLLSIQSTHASNDFELGVTQDQCAAMLGIHRATLGRAVQRLKEEGVISHFTRKSVKIVDLAALRRMAKL